MMDERRAPEEIVRHHRIERAPIIGEDEVEPFHVAREAKQPRQAGAAGERRRVFRKVDSYVTRNRLSRRKLVRHAAQDRMVCRIAERVHQANGPRSAEHTSELQSLMRSSYAVFCLKKKKKTTTR